MKEEMCNSYKFNCKKDLFLFLQNFYFTKYLHDKVKIIIDHKWIIEKNKDSENFSCIQEIVPKNRHKNTDNLETDIKMHYLIYFNRYPQHFIKSQLWKKISDHPFMKCDLRN